MRVTGLERRLMPAVITPFAPRFSANASGDILFVANTLLTASSADADAVAARAGTGTRLNNNNFTMAYVDVDANASTFNSSRANLALPAGGSVLFAGLYWGANSTSAGRNTVLFGTPGSAGYATLNGTSLGADGSANYQSFIDVTGLVRAAGVGTYTVANVQATTGTDKQAGWALVVAYGDPAAPPRNLTVFDGLAAINSTTPNATITISGFTAPPTGSVNASIGFVGYEGDLGSTGDAVKLNNTTLSDALNPATNFFNSTITNKGARVTGSSPDYVNQLGFDADIVSTSGVIPNGATSATIALTTGGETFLPGVVTTAIDLYAPVVSTGKTVVDLNGGNIEPGDILEYTDTVAVASGEAATLLTLFDPIPAFTTYVPGSLQVLSGVNAGAKTDAAGDDQANFDAANNRVVFRLGTGATAAAGGTANVGTTSTVRFRVRVGTSTPDSTPISSQATTTFTGQNTGASLSAGSTLASVAVVRRAELALSLAADNPTPNVGEFVVITATVANNGPFDGTGVQINDLLPAGLLYDSATPSQGAYNSSTGVWTVGTVVAGSPATLAVRARVVLPSAITATASIGAADLPDPVSSNNSASTTVVPRNSDLGLTQSVDVARPNVGGRVTFTTTLTNRGPDAASGVSVSALLPAGLSFVSAAPGQGTYNPATGAWAIGAVPSGGTVVLTLVADVTSPNASQATASIVASNQFDPIAGNNVASAAVVPQRADLTLAAGVDNPTPNVGDVITYTVTVTNNGPDAASGVVLAASSVPAGVQFISVTLSQGTFDQATNRWDVGTVGVGATQTFVARALVTSPTVDPLDVSIAAAAQFDPNTANNSARTSTNPLSASLSLTNTASDPRPDANELVTFTVTLRNAGPSAATGVSVLDLLPPGLTFVSASPGRGTYNPASGLWTPGTVASNEAVSLTLVARATTPDPVTSTASIASSAQFDPSTDDNSSSTTLVPRRADLSLTLSGDDPRPNVGDEVTLTFTLSNQGPDTATGVRVSGVLPASVTILSAAPGQGQFDPVSKIWDVGTVDTLAPRTLVVRVRVDTPDPVAGSATISASDQFDPDASNNSVAATAIPQRAGLSLSQASDNPTPNVGDVVTLVVTLANAGPDAATGVRVSELLPAGLSFVSAEPGQGTYDPAAGTWVVGSLGSGAQQQLTILARVTSPSAATATASVAASAQFDPSAADNVASATIVPRRADLALDAVISNAAPNLGDVISVTVTVADLGPDAATGVVVRDLLPPGLTFLAASPERGSYDQATGTWTVGTVAPGGPATLVLFARVASPSAFTSSATVVAADQFDPNSGNNTAIASATPQTVDLAVAKAVDKARPNVGDLITLTTTLTNAGPSTATGVTIRSSAGAGLTVLSSTASQGQYDPVTGIWEAGSVAASGTAVLRVVARVDSASGIASAASVAEVTQFDTSPGNNAASVGIAPQQSDLALGQAVDVATPNVGQFVTYTITLAAAGPDPATGVVVRDVLPAGLQFISSSQSRGGYDATTGLWTVGDVVPGAPQVLRIVARVAAAGATVNAASVVAADQFDPNPANNTATTASDPQQADLGLASAFDVARPNLGDLVTYTVTVADAGPAGATGVVVAAPLPAGLAFVSAAPGQGAYDPATGTWAVGALAPGGSRTLQVTARVTSPAAATATASISAADQFDPSASNNAAASTLTPQRSDLSLASTADVARPDVGDVVTLVVTLSNAGPDAATGVVVSDLLPAGLAFLGSTGPGSYDPASGVWAVGTVAPGSPSILTLRARVVAPGAQTATASVAAVDQFDPNAVNDSSSITLVPTQSDLVVGMTVDRASPNVGDLVTFVVTVANNGPDAATGVRVLDALPAGLALASAAPSRGIYSQSTGIWELGELEPGSSATLTLQATVIGAGAQTNAASILASDQFDPDAGSDVASATIVPRRSDLSLSASASSTRPNVGDVVSVTITLANAGPDAATGVRVADPIPAGLALVSATPSLGQYDPSTGAWTLAAVPSGAAPTLTLNLRVVSPGPTTNVASVVAADQFDPDQDDRVASTALVPQRSDLALSATAGNPTPNVGDVVSFAVTLANDGPDAASGVAVAVPVPAGFTLVSATPGQGVYDPASGTWTVGAVAPGAPITLTLLARVDVADPPRVSASVAAVDQFDPDAADNAASTGVAPRKADLGVAAIVSDPTPNVGDTITYTIFLENSGPDAASGVSLLDVLPAGVTFVSATPGRGTYDPATGIWAVGSVAAGEELTLALVATVDDPVATVNRVEIVAVDQFDPFTPNDSAETSTAPQQSELRLVGRVDRPRPNVGDTVTFTLSLANLGPDAATGIVVDAALPAGFAFASATPGAGIYDPASGTWTLASLAGGSTASLTVSAVVAAPGASTSVATIRQADQFDPNLANNRSEVQVVPQRVDLGLSASVDVPRPNVGDVVTFTVTVANAGPDAATGVIALEPLPPGLVFLGAVPGVGTYDPTTGTWTIGGLAPGTSTTLTVSARVAAAGIVTTTARVAASDQFDSAGGNDAVSISVAPQSADLALSVTADRPRPNVGDVVTITVTLANAGADLASGVRVANLLPAGLALVSATPSRGTYDPATGLWDVDAIAPGTSGVLVLRASVVSPSAGTASASIVASAQFDPDPADNAASVAVVPRQSDLTAGLSVDVARPDVGDVITLTATVTNAGPDASGGVVVLGSLPDGLAFEAADPDQGGFSPTNGIWTVGEVAPGATLNLRVRVRVVAPGPQTTSITVLSADQFDPDPADNAASITVTPRQSNLALASSVDVARPNVGDLVTITVTLADLGPDPATGVVVSSLLPSGLALVSADPGAGTYDPSMGLWAVGTVDPATPRTLRLVARVVAPGALAPSASVVAADQFDPSPADDSASVAITPQRADLTLNATVDDLTPVAGQVLTFTLTLANRGPDAATGVRVTGALPPGLRPISVTPGAGVFDPATATWIIDSLAPGASVSLQLQAVAVDAAPSLATAVVIAADQFEAGDGVQASVAVLPDQAGLGLAIVGDAARPDVGDVVTFTVTLSNAGPLDATGVAIAVPLPAGLAFVSATPARGAYDPGTGTWSVGSVPASGATTLVIRARVVSPSATAVTASVAAVVQFDPAPGDDVASFALAPTQVDLALGAEGVPASAVVGQVVAIRLVVSNNGPDGASGVVLPVSLPPGFRLLASSPGQGTYDPSTGLWLVGAIPGGQSRELLLSLEAIAPGDAAIAAGPVRSDEFDRDATNDALATSVAVTAVVPPPVDPPPVDPPPVDPPPVDPPPVDPPPVDPPPVDPPGRSGVLRGSLFTDLDGDGARDPGEPGLGGLMVVLEGVDSAGNLVRRAAFTATDGTYAFDGLPAGVYSLIVADEAGAVSGVPGNLGGQAQGGRVSGIVLGEGAVGGGYAFAAPAASGRISGRVYLDLYRDGVFGPGDFGVATIRVVLTGVDDRGARVRLATTTAADGTFSFGGLRPGSYAIQEQLPRSFRGHRSAVGTAGGVARADRIQGINLAAGASATGYGFGTLPSANCVLRPLVVVPGTGRAPLGPDTIRGQRAVPRGPLVHRFVPDLNRILPRKAGRSGAHDASARPVAKARSSRSRAGD